MKSLTYWAEQAATVDGVLGGYGYLHNKDILASRRFLRAVGPKSVGVSAELAAGIGRVTQGLLKDITKDEVHIYEPVPKLLEQARTNLKDVATPVIRYYTQTLQQFAPPDGVKYDLIWIQWCTLYICDDDLVALLNKCAAILKDLRSCVVLKDNAPEIGFADSEDDSYVRSYEETMKVIAKSKLSVRKIEWQQGWPSSLCRVAMWALSP